MLISRRKEGEGLLIGDGIEIRVIGIRKKRVILGVLAPRDIKITPTKLSDAELENTMAAAHSIELADLLPQPPVAGERAVFLLGGGETKPQTADKKSGKPE